MALTSSQQWWVRTDGAETNGGGYDATVSGAGTNYSDQAAAQLSLTDLACANNTTLTSATGGFTTAMIGNIIRIASGTNFTAGYYMVTARTDTNTVTLDRNPTTGASASSGVGKLGGAHANLTSYASGGTATGPILTSPLAAGHIVNVRGGGTDDPASADYTPAGGTGYWLFPVGNVTIGVTRFVGYNGRPCVSSDGVVVAGAILSFQTFKFIPTGTTIISGGDNPGSMLCASDGKFGTTDGSVGSGLMLSDIYFDQNGKDFGLCNFVADAWRVWARNTGSTSAGTVQTLRTANHGGYVVDSRFQDQCGWAIEINQIGGAVGNVITNCRNTSKGAINTEFSNTTNPLMVWVVNNTLDNNLGKGIRAGTAGSCWSVAAFNNILSNNAVGLDFTAGGDAFVAIRPDFNAFYNNTTARSNISAGPNDVTLTGSPYTNPGAGDYGLNSTGSAGTACRGAAMGVPGGTSTSLLDIGALQHIAAVQGAVVADRPRGSQRPFPFSPGSPR